MPAEVFLDTNVFVYAFDASAPAKRDRAKVLIREAHWFVSWQIIQEFANVALHRFEIPLRPDDLSEYLDLVLWPRCRVLPSPTIQKKALEIHRKLQYRLYDSLVVASALAGGATILYSEDLQHGRTIGPMRIENPFAGL
ncbi:MAG: PIN domain-containing protein [Verrucomicrobiota bacterium]